MLYKYIKYSNFDGTEDAYCFPVNVEFKRNTARGKNDPGEEITAHEYERIAIEMKKRTEQKFKDEQQKIEATILKQKEKKEKKRTHRISVLSKLGLKDTDIEAFL